MHGDRSSGPPGPRKPRGTLPGTRPSHEPSPVIRRDTGPPHPAIEQTAPLERSPSPPTPEVTSRQRHAPAPPRRPAPSTGSPPPRPRTRTARRKRSKRRWGRRVAFSILVVLLLAGTGIIGVAGWLDTSLHREPILTDYPGRPGPGRGTNWLLVGSDSRQGLTDDQQQRLATGGDTGAGRTDTILLVHVPGFTSDTPTTLVSIPRDSYVPIPGHGRDKVNAAFALGGPQLLTRTIEQTTGLRLDHYAEIGFGGFAVVVDALGGVTVCPDAPITDPLAGVDLPSGCQRLDGRNALGYVRTRATPRADLDRMVNQREFMSALLHRAASPAVWLSPWRWYSVSRAAAHALNVDQNDHVWDLALLGWALHGSTTTMTVPIGEFAYSDAGAVVVWNHEAAGELFDALAADAPVPSGSLTDRP
ncbi:LCP family protein [Mycobacterium spongiae]|uniref:LytR family transcriptional regulator n=1 Tax=Mycobacterium spongiae TaxID=886343 RepID=A0A975PYM4_9MYCO|nr:LCP family protein [Mycobacterium spongiae]QUR69400.1 LytR family transcriptional regulator [Mycobacterium spongiae]